MATNLTRYAQHIQDLRSEYRPQREWSEGRGLFLVTGHFLNGVAAGAWLLGLLYADTAVLVAAFLLGGLGGLAHLGFLGRPERAWKMMLHVRTSWISRGFIGLSLFLIGGVLYLPPLMVPAWAWNAGSAAAETGYVLAGAGALVMMAYMGFVYTASKGVPFWNSALHPVLYIGYALRGGIAVLLVAAAARGIEAAAAAELTRLWLGVTGAVVLLWLIDMYQVNVSGDEAARRSLHDLLAGRVARWFYGGTLAIGLIVPALLLAGFGGDAPARILALVGLASVAGDFFVKFSTIKAGVYMPLRVRRTPRPV